MSTMTPCFVTCPSVLPDVVTISTYGSTVPVGPIFAYATTNTNYFGATGCSILSLVKPTPSTSYQPADTKRCTLPLSVSGKPNTITPVVSVPRTKTSGSTELVYTQAYTCDPILAATANAQNFKFVCSGLAWKDLNQGLNGVTWYASRVASITLNSQRFGAGSLSSTPFYVLDPAKATTTTVPTTFAYTTLTGSTTITLTARTSIIRTTVGTSTSTCTATTTKTITVPPAGAGGNSTASSSSSASASSSPSTSTSAASTTPTGLTTSQASAAKNAAVTAPVRVAQRDPDDTPSTSALDDPHTPMLYEFSPNTHDVISDPLLVEDPKLHDDEDSLLDEQSPRLRFKRAPTLGRPDATYPPYGKSTVFVSSLITSTLKIDSMSKTTITPPVVTTTTSVYDFTIAYESTTVTVTKTASTTSTTSKATSA